MWRLKSFFPVVGIVLAVVFVAGLIHLLRLRYNKGDIYPAYSTLRTDPMGSRVLYEGLDATHPGAAARNFEELRNLLKSQPDTVIFLGMKGAYSGISTLGFTKSEADALNRYVTDGGRVVMAFAPVRAVSEEEIKEEEKKAEKTKEDKDKKDKKDKPSGKGDDSDDDKDDEKADDERDWKTHLLTELWNFSFERGHFDPKTADEEERHSPTHFSEWAVKVVYDSIERSVPWKSALYFSDPEAPWEVIYRAKKEPVIMTRRLGAGEIVLVGDSYFLSNEAMKDARRPRLLVYLLGSGNRVVFDEVHLGTEHEEGVLALIKKFRLEGLLYGFAFLAVLFIWRNGSPLVPPDGAEPEAPAFASAGKDAHAGLANLLRRNIPPGDLLPLCWSEWKRSAGLAGKSGAANAAEAENAAASATPQTAVETYHRIRKSLPISSK